MSYNELQYVNSKVKRLSHQPFVQVYFFWNKRKYLWLHNTPEESRSWGSRILAQIGGLPPVRFVNYPPKKPAGNKLSFVKITFSKSFTKNYEIFVTGNMEVVIKLGMVHETILMGL